MISAPHTVNPRWGHKREGALVAEHFAA